MSNQKFFIVLFIVSIGCQDSNQISNHNLKTFSLKGLTNTSIVKLSDLGFVDIEYVPLETKENSLVHRIMDIKVDSDYYLIKYFNTILKFQKNGLFVAKIGTEGRGPEEFLVAHDVGIDSENHHIYLADGWAGNFYEYDKNGKFVKTFRSPLNTSNFNVSKDGILCYCTNYIANIDTSYVLIDINGQIVKSFPNNYIWNYTVQRGTFVFTENIFYEFGGQLFKKEVYSDTIYLFEDKIFKPHLIIEHGKRLLTTHARSNFEPEYLREHFINQNRLFEFGDYIYYDFILNGAMYVFLGSKEDRFQTFVEYDQGLINDLDGGPNILPKTIKNDSTIISWVDVIELKKHINSEEFKNSSPKYIEKKEELEKLANGLKETDNPVLILVKLNK